MKQFIKYILILLVAIPAKIFSQEVPKGLELVEIMKIAETYRSTTDLSFSMLCTYADSAAPATIVEQLAGRYKIHEGKFWSMLDSIEYLQGGLYNMAVYHKDSVIIISNRQEYTSVLQLPLMDSLFLEASVAGMMVTRVNDSTRALKILFTEQSPYRSYEVQYDLSSYLIRKVKYYLAGAAGDTPGGSGVTLITMNFDNYSDAVNSDEYFKESKFVYRHVDEILAQPAYSGYKIIFSGNNPVQQ